MSSVAAGHDAPGTEKSSHCSSVISALPPAQSTLKDGLKMACESERSHNSGLSLHIEEAITCNHAAPPVAEYSWHTAISSFYP